MKIVNKTDEINWQASLDVRVNQKEISFGFLKPEWQNQILFDIANGHYEGCYTLYHERHIEWSIFFNIQINDIEIPFKALNVGEQEEIRWQIAVNELWQGSFDRIQPIWGEAVEYGL